MARIDVAGEEQIVMPFRYTVKKPVKGHVFLVVELEGGRQRRLPTKKEGNSYTANVKVDEGQEGQFRFELESADGNVTQLYPKTGMLDFIAEEGDEEEEVAEVPAGRGNGRAERGGRHEEPDDEEEEEDEESNEEDEIHEVVHKRVEDILHQARHGKGRAEIEASLHNLDIELETNSVVGDSTGFILDVVVEVLSEDESIARAVRASLKGKHFNSFDQLQAALQKGALAYAKQVFNTLKADAASREALHIEDDAVFDAQDPLGSPRLNTLFMQRCNEHSLILTADEIGEAMSLIAEQGRSEKVQERLGELAEEMGLELEPLKPEKEHAHAAPSKKAKLTELGITGGLEASMFLWEPSMFFAWLGKGVFEGVAGAHLSDIPAEGWSGVWERVKKNNAFRRWWTEDETSLWDITKQGIGDWLKRSIPVGGALYYGGTQPEEHGEHGEHGGEKKHGKKHEAGHGKGHGKHAEHAKANPEALIKAACEKNL